MYQVTTIKKIPSQCDNYTGQRTTLREGGLTLVVPNLAEDTQIRWQMERGVKMTDAYKRAGASRFIPDPAIRSCISLVFQTPYFDLETGTWKTSAGKYTCIGFQKCLQEYAEGQAISPEDDPENRRLLIAPGVFAPSPAEEACIKQTFLSIASITDAYEQCGADDILPEWPGAADFIQNAFITAISEQKRLPPLYTLTKRSHQLYAIQPPDEDPNLPTPATPVAPVTPPAEEEPKKSNLIYYVAGGIAILALTR